MKTGIKNLFLLPALIAGLGLILAGRVAGQTFTTLYSFTAITAGTNSDGANPYAGLILSGNTLYGTAANGGSSGNGAVFALNTDGSGFTNLHSFTFSDGANPYASLILSGNTLYGTARNGGSSGTGTVFSVNTDDSGFANLHSFTFSDGASPYASLILSGNTLYGTAYRGGSSGNGAVFALNTDGTDFTNLHSFTARSGFPSSTNSDGANPYASLILSSNTLYGTALGGGSSGRGTVFKVNTDGTGFTNLHNFTGNSDGVFPYGGLILSGNTLYGTTYGGGSSDGGTVFKVNTDGTSFTNLHSFTGTDGTRPYDRLLLSGNTLYGTAATGSSSGKGTVFAVNTDGTDFTNLHSFTAFSNSTNSDGANPNAGLVLSGNTLYGTAVLGGDAGKGTVFSLSFSPQLTILPSGTNVILTWPANYAGFDYTGFTLQSAPAITGTFTNVPGATSPYTNPISGTQQFFRLSQ